jgi:hypothetical protein
MGGQSPPKRNIGGQNDDSQNLLRLVLNIIQTEKVFPNCFADSMGVGEGVEIICRSLEGLGGRAMGGQSPPKRNIGP